MTEKGTTFEITLLPVAAADAPGPEVFWMARFDEWISLTFQVVLARSADTTVLVNTGPGHLVEEINAVWAPGTDQRAAMRVSAEHDLLGQLAARGVGAEDVTDVVLTPLQLYTTGGIRSFPRARIHMSKRGWLHFHSTHSHPHDIRWSSISRPDLVHLVTDAWERVHLLEDEDQVVPGIRTWHAGAHHRATLAVEIEAPVGLVVASDAFFQHTNIEQMHPIGICENIDEALAAYDRIRRNADTYLSLYDAANFDRHPDGRIV